MSEKLVVDNEVGKLEGMRKDVGKVGSNGTGYFTTKAKLATKLAPKSGELLASHKGNENCSLHGVCTSRLCFKENSFTLVKQELMCLLLRVLGDGPWEGPAKWWVTRKAGTGQWQFCSLIVSGH